MSGLLLDSLVYSPGSYWILWFIFRTTRSYWLLLSGHQHKRKNISTKWLASAAVSESDFKLHLRFFYWRKDVDLTLEANGDHDPVDQNAKIRLILAILILSVFKSSKLIL